MDCKSVSAAERVCDCGEGVQCPKERKPSFFMPGNLVMPAPICHYRWRLQPRRWQLVIISGYPVPQAADHVLHDERVLPAVGQFPSLSPGDRIGRRSELAKKGQRRVGTGALSPRAHAVFPPIHEKPDPPPVLWKSERYLHLLAAGDAAVQGPAIVQDSVDHGVVGIIDRPREFPADQIMREIGGQTQIGKTIEQLQGEQKDGRHAVAMRFDIYRDVRLFAKAPPTLKQG